MSDQILVPALAVPPMPLVLADSAFLATLATTESQIKALVIVDDASLSAAGRLLNDLTTAGARLEGVRVKLKEPFLQVGRQIDMCAKAPADRIDAQKRSLKLLMGRFVDDQRAKAAVAERERQADIRRLEEEKRKADDEAKARAELIAAAAKNANEVSLDFDDDTPPAKTELEVKLEALKYAPVAARPVAPTGIRFIVRLIATVQDEAKLPEPFVIRTPNEQLIRQTYCVGYKEGDPIPELPGVTFTVSREPASTGKTTLR